MCNCVNVEMGSYDNVVILDTPPHMDGYRQRRNAAGLSGDNIQVDRCIAAEIQELWSKGILTYGSCCGHNKTESMVNVAPIQAGYMLAMGYVMNHGDPNRHDTFRLKTAGI